MGRIRNIHPGQWFDEDFGACTPLACLLALAVRNLADDNGIFEYKTKLIHLQCFALWPDADIPALIRELEASNQIAFYQGSDGKPYGIIRNFRKFQTTRWPSYRYPLPTPALIHWASPMEGLMEPTLSTHGVYPEHSGRRGVEGRVRKGEERVPTEGEVSNKGSYISTSATASQLSVVSLQNGNSNSARGPWNGLSVVSAQPTGKQPEGAQRSTQVILEGVKS